MDDMDLDVDLMWNKMEQTIKVVAKEVLGESMGRGIPNKNTSWWNEEVKKAIQRKRECYKALGKCRTMETFEKYKVAKREAKKAVRDAKAKVNEELYARLGTKEGEKGIYRLARLRDKKTQDIKSIKCIKDVDQRVLVEDQEIKDRWRSYFDNLFNGNHERDVGDLNIPKSMINRDYMRRVQMQDVKEALRKMKLKKATGPDEIPIEVWKSLGERGIKWLTSLFNKIWECDRMPLAWRTSVTISLYKNKGDV